MFVRSSQTRPASVSGGPARLRRRVMSTRIFSIVAFGAIIWALGMPARTSAIAAGQRERSISGRVVDGAGRAMPGAQAWLVLPNPAEEDDYQYAQAIADSSGRFTIKWDSRPGSQRATLYVIGMPSTSGVPAMLLEPPFPLGPPYPKLLSSADPRFAGRQVDLTGPGLNLGDIAVQVRFGLLSVWVNGVQRRVPDSEGKALLSTSDFSVRIRDRQGDILRDFSATSQTVSEGVVLSILLPEGDWGIEVLQINGAGQSYYPAGPVTVRADAPGDVRVDTSTRSPAAHALGADAGMADPAAAKRELALLGIEDSDESLIERVDAGNDRAVALFMKAGRDPNLQTPDHFTLLMTAVRNGDAEMAQALIRGGAAVNAVLDELEGVVLPNARAGFTALQHGALRNGDILRMLLAAGADPNIATADGDTPLMFACKLGMFDNAKMLLAAGADPNRVANDGYTALRWAEETGFGDIAEILKRAGVKK
jgi:hypothetical protein